MIATVVLVLSSVIAQLPVVDSDDLRFVHLTSLQGMAATHVRQIVQDDDGFIWFGTEFGLIRYDGYRFKVFAHDPHRINSLGGAHIDSLFKDSAGHLWMGADDVLDKFDPKTEIFTHHQLHGINGAVVRGSIININQDLRGEVWLATHSGLFEINTTTGVLKAHRHEANDPQSLASDDIKSTLEDSHHRFWVATPLSLDEFNRETGRVVRHVPFTRATREFRIFEDHTGLLWLGYAAGDGGGLSSFDPETNAFIHYTFTNANSGTAYSGVYAIAEDRGKSLWIGTGGMGLLRFDRQGKRFVRYRSQPGDPDSLDDDHIVSLLIDREGNLWTGLASIGPDITNLQPRPFRRVIRSLGRHGGGELLVNCIFRDRKGRTWIGSAGGLFQLDPQTGLTTFVPVTQKGMSPGVTSIDEDNAGNLWLATVGQGLKQFDPARKQVIRSFVHEQDNAASLSSDVVTSLRYDSDTLWLSTWDGFDQLDTLTGQFQVYKRDMHRLTEPYGRFARDDHGRFWIGSDSGLVRFDPATRRFDEFLHTTHTGAISNDHVSSVYIDSRGRVWTTTQSGLDEWDGEASFTTYRPTDGLGGIAFSCVMEDDTGELWVGSNKGISRFSPTAHTFTNYSDADGIGDLTGLRSAPGACSKGRDGEMYFGGFSGLYSFQARNIRDRNSDAPVRIVDFRLNGQSVHIGSEVTLTHDLRNFSVEFASLNFLDTAATRYRYSLSGLDSRWTYVGSDQRSVNYISLPTGAYIFNVQAAVGRGDWSSLGASLRIRILPPWWQTWWFRAAAGCAGVLLLWVAWSYRLRILERDYEVRLNERVFERTRIARELHDSLLQGFQGVMLRLQAVRELLPARVSDAVQMLEGALDSGDHAIIEGREAVQNLRSSASADFDLESALKSLGTELLTGDAKDAISFRVIVQGKSRVLAPLTQDEIYQIAREAFRNALRHAHASSIELELEYGDSVFRLRLRDDGKGIDAGALARATAGKHWGVQGMRERAASLGGRLEIWAQAGAGTEVFLEIPTHSTSSRSAPRRPPDRTRASQDA